MKPGAAHNASLSRARLLTMKDGATVVTEPGQPLAILEELGLTAADLWLSERILWVEGPSEVGVIEALVRELDDPALMGINVQPLPTTSRFAARGPRGARQTFDFLQAVTAAVTPLPLTMLFLFDADEKSDEVRTEIERASGARARFLPVREVENLLLDQRSIHELLFRRCSALGLDVPTFEEIQREYAQLLAADDPSLFPSAHPTDDEARESIIVGSEVLNRLYQRFLLTEYRKVQDGAELARVVYANAPARLEPLQSVLLELVAAEQ